MTDPLSVGIAVAAAGVALAIGYLQWPRPPALDGERWFKTMLTTLLRGEVEARDGTGEEWEAEVLRFVPWHPAGRFPERKVANPLAAHLPGAHLPGEQALLEALARHADPVDRWARMYDTDESALAERFDDPIGLGPDYDPATHLGAANDWEALARWGAGDAGFEAALRQRLGAKWVLVEGRADRLAGPSVLDALQGLIGDRAVRIPWAAGTLEERVAAVGTSLTACLDGVEDRLVLVAEEAGVAVLLRVLHGMAPLRDQVLAVVSVGGVIGGRTDEEGPYGAQTCGDWLGQWFTHEHLDTEVVRFTPYLAIQWLDRKVQPFGARGLPLEASRFPAPEEDRVETLEAVDLGPLPVDNELPLQQVARALWATVTCWVLSRR